ncbi:MAG: helix-turn-helix domain-containing protein [Candidatus Levybacteria bacterium]|nr:helix-turn-helix domain-containing protein [Candidatus Levybacteria bacterium]
MPEQIIEASYPLSFREGDAKSLGQRLKNRRSVVLIGMKRVGISNFLRFFLYHKEIRKTYIGESNHFFIPVDLNELVEREIYPFWVLTLKRIQDAINDASEIDSESKKQAEIYFLNSIESQDLLMTIDSVRKSLNLLVNSGLFPTIFYLRFDRIKDAATPEFFSNLQSLIENTHHKLAFVFTSARRLSDLSPNVFKKQSLSVFADNVYIKPAKKEDTRTVLKAIKETNKLNFNEDFEEKLLEYVDGYIQHLQFALISLGEKEKKPKQEELSNFLLNDERISLQSEELWESINPEEQKILLKLSKKEKISKEDEEVGEYFIKTGFFDLKRKKIFSPLFEEYLKTKHQEKRKDEKIVDLSRKELLLLNFLEQNKDQVCEREQIIEAVWPEAEELGVTDWAIDRLVARLRGKLKVQNSKYEIVTVKTRGYKLTE